MHLKIYKYQGTGNDFLMIDNRDLMFPKTDTNLVKELCDRRFGIGGDGLILLENDAENDFQMVYYNADGNQSSMCGNGGRCIVAFAKQLGIIDKETTFLATDGLHHATIYGDQIALQMKNVDVVNIKENYSFLDTGSPHHIQFEADLENLDVKKIGASIRYSDLYGQSGSNVNFVKQINANTFKIRTYERGVEDETLSCGTGATAVAIAMKATKTSNDSVINILVEGGVLEISFEEIDNQYKNVILKGPAKFVFETGWVITNY